MHRPSDARPVLHVQQSGDDIDMRFGIVGTGLMAQEHIRTLALVPGLQVAALADPVPDSIAWARHTLGAGSEDVPAFDSVEAMLGAGGLDAVIVCSPNHTHHDVLDSLLATDLHILCEKPLCTTVADARAVAERAEARARGVFWVAMEYRFMPPVRSFIDDLHDGRVGTLRRVALHEHRFPFLRKVGDWNRFNRNTGGTMVEKCCHFFDLMRHMVRAEPVRVFCSGAADVNHRDELYGGEVPDIIDNSYTIVEFDNGARAMLDLCMFADGAEEQERITAIGDAAMLEVGIPSGAKIFSPRVPLDAPKRIEREHVPVDARALAAGNHHGASYGQLLAFLDAANGRGPVQVTARDGLSAVAIGVAAERSAAEHRAVAIEEVL
ncbi:Gfo/Idh/MocA family oxidoreductase [Acetobacteraceae bacterium KSS8]|uniref:Gfo/Idh/MocA family oxidoreductase n=1 Tax=Endosaccharibacter trunci TaxID=2812733 RepID=A0ABT1W8D5_9PROT|nr:Gfo/Idh/MocA family oxidoreductase [Acetobacteraceae bacterium KSS8]